MIAALLLAGSSWSATVWVTIPPSAATLAAVTADPDEVVVNGELLRRTKFKVSTDRRTGVASCTLKRAGGNPGLDAALCEAALSCNIPPIRSKALEACLYPAVGRVIRARYPGQEVTHVPR